MSRRPRKKIREKRVVLILVEGDSEIEALPAGLIEAVGEDKFKVYFAKKNWKLARELAHGRSRLHEGDRDDSGGDLFGEAMVNEDNIVDYIDDWYISTWLQENDRLCVHRKDIRRIYHIIDMDGSYIPDECVIYGGSSRQHNVYRDSGIQTSGKTGTERQRQIMAHRRKNIDAALVTEEIVCNGARIPYKLYFFSSNLDHFIHNDANLPSYKKVGLAADFSDRFFGDPEGYASFFGAGDKNTTNWLESWDLVRSGMNSILRGTNYGILIDDLLRYKLELIEEDQR